MSFDGSRKRRVSPIRFDPDLSGDTMGIAMTDYCSGLPRVYGRNKRSLMLDRWDGDPGEAVRMYGAQIFPGVPLPLLIGLSANSQGPTEAISSAGFWEIGLYNVPAGSPSAEPPEPGSTYWRIARDAATERLLGRSVDLGRGRSGSWTRDIAGQVVVGLKNYREDRDSISRRIPEALRPQALDSPWAMALAVFGYVESNGAVRAINLFATELAAFDEQQRFQALCALLADRFEESGQTDRAMAYPLVRAMQRFQCGKVIAEARGISTSWWPVFGEAEGAIEHWLTLARYGQPSGCEPQLEPRIDPGAISHSSGPSTGATVAIAAVTVGVVGALGAGWLWFRRQ